MPLVIGASDHTSGAFLSDIRQRSGQNPSQCYQCGKCTAGCPMAFAMDIDPARVMRLVQLGQRDAVLQSHSIWLCASCETCATRCPQEVELSRVMDALRIMARESGVRPAEPAIATGNQTFLAGIKARGRVHEVALLMFQGMKRPEMVRDAPKGLVMLRRGKISLRGHKVRNLGRVRRLFGE